MPKLLKALLNSPTFKKYLNTGILVLILFFSWGTWVNAKSPVTAQGRIYVQTVSGQTIEALAAKELHRDKTIVSRFAKDFVLKSFQWQASIKGQVEDNVTYPSAFHAYSWKVDETIRPQWLYNQGRKYEQTRYPFGKFFNGSINAIPRSAMEPVVKELAPGKWSAEVKASRHFYDKKGKGLHSEILHFELIIEAKTPDVTYRWGSPETLMGQALNEAQLDGLKIIQINDYSKGIA